MEQLMMWWALQPLRKALLPEGFKIRSYQDGDAWGWINVCRTGELGAEETTEADFTRDMLNGKGIKPEGIFFIINDKDEIVGTATGMFTNEEGKGCLHMVCIHPECRGMGLSAALNSTVLEYLVEHGCRNVILRTDDFRIPAIKSYLSLGFRPIINNEEMAERWRKILLKVNWTSVETYDVNGLSGDYITVG